jgi:tubulin polyglutamylase TTLL9
VVLPLLQGDYALFAEEFKRRPNSTWIMKPIARSQGRGIFIFQKLSQISKWKSENRWKPDKEDAEAYVVQRYITSPYLVGGRKVTGPLHAIDGWSGLTVACFLAV